MYLEYEREKKRLEAMRIVANGLPKDFLGEGVSESFKRAVYGFDNILEVNAKRQIEYQEQTVEELENKLRRSKVIIDRIYVLKYILKYTPKRIASEVHYSEGHIYRILKAMKYQIQAL